MANRSEVSMAPRVALVLVAAAIVLAACSDSAGDTTTTSITTTTPPTTTATTTTTTTTTSTTTTTTTTTLPPDADAGLDLPRETVYAHITFEISAAKYSNAAPGTYLEDEPGIGDERFLYLDFNADFENEYPGRSADIEIGNFALLLSDGTSITANAVDFARTILLFDEAVMSALAFPGNDFNLDGAVLVFDNDVNEPMVLPLDGPVPTDPYPILVEVDAGGDAVYEGGCGVAAGTVNVLDAEWDIDGGIDQDREAIIGSGTPRSVVGERFLRVRVQAIAVNGTCGGTVMTSSLFRLVVDGLPLGTENSFVMLLNDGEGAEIIWGFRVPIEAEDVALEVGLPGGDVALFPIPVPAELP